MQATISKQSRRFIRQQGVPLALFVNGSCRHSHRYTGFREGPMKTMVRDLPTFAFVVGIRAALAGGLALLVAGTFTANRRRAIGAALVAVGTATTIPAAIAVVRGLRGSRQRGLPSGVECDERLIGATRYPRKGDDDVV
jgi:hypothetical protein